MTEPSPQYRYTPSGDELHALDLELLERTHIAALCAIWKAQGKRKKIVTLPPVDTAGVNVVILQCQGETRHDVNT